MVTAVLGFVEDPVSRYIGSSDGLEYSGLSVLHGRRDLPSEACVTSGRSQEKR